MDSDLVVYYLILYWIFQNELCYSEQVLSSGLEKGLELVRLWVVWGYVINLKWLWIKHWCFHSFTGWTVSESQRSISLQRWLPQPHNHSSAPFPWAATPLIHVTEPHSVIFTPWTCSGSNAFRGRECNNPTARLQVRDSAAGASSRTSDLCPKNSSCAWSWSETSVGLMP